MGTRMALDLLSPPRYLFPPFPSHLLQYYLLRKSFAHSTLIVPRLLRNFHSKKGDFFYVLNSGEDGNRWFEAHNPVTGARGLVPRHMFEEFSKNTSYGNR